MSIPAIAVARELRGRSRRMIGDFEAFTEGWGPVEVQCSEPEGSDAIATFEVQAEGERLRVTVEKL